jgi:hypothetical protein
LALVAALGWAAARINYTAAREARARLAKQEAENADLRGASAEQKTALARLAEALKVRDADLERLRGEAGRQLAELEQARQALSKSQTEYAQLRQKAQGLEGELAREKQAAATREADLARLRGEAGARQAELTRVQQEIGKRDAEVSRLRKDMTTVQAERQQGNTKIRRYDALMKGLTAERGPTAADLAIPSGEDRKFLDEVLARIFPAGQAQLSAEQKCIQILKFVASYHKLRSNSGTATKILRDGYAICGGLSHVFRVLCRKAGLPARYVGIFGLPGQGSHALAEVHYDGKWHLYDPTFAVFFYTHAAYGPGWVLSLNELLQEADGAFLMKVVAKPWEGYGEKERAFPVTPVEEGFLPGMLKPDFTTVYKQYFRDTFPVAREEDASISLPVLADLTQVSEFRVGAKDQEWTDVSRATARQNFVGSHGVGGENPVSFHTLRIKAPKRSTVEITYTATSASRGKLVLVPLWCVHAMAREETEREVTWRVMIQGEEGLAAVFCPEGAFLVDSVVIRRIAEQ